MEGVRNVRSATTSSGSAGEAVATGGRVLAAGRPGIAGTKDGSGDDALDAALDAVAGAVARTVSLDAGGAALIRGECGRSWYQK
jgi:hypothetical protein